MNTYDESSYREASSVRACNQCQRLIIKGDRFLRYLREDDGYHLAGWENICHTCSLSKTRDDKPHFWCQAVEEELERLGLEAAHLPPRDPYPADRDLDKS